MFGLGTFAAGASGSFPGLVLEQRVIDLRPHFGATATTGELLASWDDTLRSLQAILRSLDASGAADSHNDQAYRKIA